MAQENLTVKISVEGKQAEAAVGKFARSLNEVSTGATLAGKKIETAEGAFSRFGKAAIVMNQSLELIGRTFNRVQQIVSKPLLNATSLERSTAEIRTLLDSATKDVVNFNDEILRLQREFGSNPQVAAKAFYEAISSNATDAVGSIELLNVAQKTAVGGVTSLQESVNGITNVLNAYGMEASDSVHVSDVLFLSMKAGKTTIGELSSELGKVLTFAANAGVSFEELSAAVSTVTTAGVKTNVATTAIRAAIVALLRPSEDLKAAYKQLGISSIDATLKQQGLVETIRQIAGSVGGSTSAITKLFGSVESLPAVTALASATIGGNFDKLASDIEKSSGEIGKATDDAFSEIASTSDFQLGLVKAAFDATMTEIGFAMKGTFVDVAQSISSTFTSMVEATKPLLAALKAIDFAEVFKGLAIVVGILGATYLTTLLPAIIATTGAFIAQEVAVVTLAIATGTLTSTMVSLAVPMAAAAAKGLLFVAAVAGIDIAIRNASRVLDSMVVLWDYFILKLAKVDEAMIRLRISFKEAIGADTAKAQLELLNNLRTQVGLQTEISKSLEQIEKTGFDAGFIGVIFDEGKKALDAFNGSLDVSAKTGKALESTMKAMGNATGEGLPGLDPAAITEAKAKFDELVKAQALLGANNLESAALARDARLAEIKAIEKALQATDQLAGKESELQKARQLAFTEYEAAQKAFNDEQQKAADEQLKYLEENRKAYDDMAKSQSLYGLNALESSRQVFESRMNEIDLIEEQLRLTNQLAGRESEISKARQIAADEQASQQRLAGPAPELVQGVSDAMAPITETIMGFGSVITGPVGAANAAISAAQGIVDAVPQLLNNAANLINSITDLPMAIVDGVVALAKSIPRLIAEFIPNIINAIPEIIDVLITELLIGIPDAVIALVDGIMSSIDMLIGRIPELAEKFIYGVIVALPKIQAAFLKLFVQAGPRIAIGLIKAAPDIAIGIANGIVQAIAELGNVFGDIFDFGSLGDGIADGIGEAYNEVSDTISKIGEETFRVLDLNAAAKGLDLADKIGASIASGATSAGNFLKRIWGGLMDALKMTWEFVMNYVTASWDFLIDNLTGVFEFGVSIFTAVWDFAKVIFQGGADILLSVWDVLKSVWNFAVDILMVPIDLFKAMWNFVAKLFDDPIAAFKGLWTDLKGIFTGVFDSFNKIIDSIAGVGTRIWDGFKKAFEGVGDLFVDVGTAIVDGFKAAIGSVGNFLAKIFTFDGGGTEAVEEFLGFDFPWFAFAKGGVVPGMASVAGDSLKNDKVPAMLSPGELVIPRSAVAAGVEGIEAFLGKTMTPDRRGEGGLNLALGWKDFDITNKDSGIRGVGRSIDKNVLSPIAEAAVKLPQNVIDAANALIDFGGSVDWLRMLTDPLGAIKSALGSMTGFMTDIFKNWVQSNTGNFATGGYVSGYGTGDSVNAMLTPGEFVLNRATTSRLGTDFLNRVNRGQSSMGQGDQTINMTINTTQAIDEAFIRTRLIPEVKRQLKRDSLDGRRVLSPTGVR